MTGDFELDRPAVPVTIGLQVNPNGMCAGEAEVNVGESPTRRISSTGNPPALPEDSRSLTAPGVFAESIFREPLEGYERTEDANV
jgi:hypothetical protein